MENLETSKNMDVLSTWKTVNNQRITRSMLWNLFRSSQNHLIFENGIHGRSTQSARPKETLKKSGEQKLYPSTTSVIINQQKIWSLGNNQFLINSWPGQW